MSKLLKLAEKIEAKLADAKVRSRGSCVFPAEHSSVKDNKDHFPINSEAQGRDAISRVNQYSSAPPWYSGNLSSLINAVYRAVHGKFKGIKIDDTKKKPGKG